jgi:hypothetical protein
MIRNFNVDLDGTGTRTVPLFRAVRPGRLISGSWFQEADTAGTTMLLKVRNLTRSVDLTAAVDLAPSGALAGGVFVVNTDGSADIAVGDLIALVLTATAGTTGPSELGIELDVNEGRAYIGQGIGG